jgi:hypothetical protein
MSVRTLPVKPVSNRDRDLFLACCAAIYVAPIGVVFFGSLVASGIARPGSAQNWLWIFGVALFQVALALSVGRVATRLASRSTSTDSRSADRAMYGYLVVLFGEFVVLVWAASYALANPAVRTAVQAWARP